MAYDDVITRNDDGELAVRTVSVSEGNAPANYDDVFTRTTDGKLAVRVTGNGGGGSGDQHNLGYYATQSALEEAHPTAEAGDYAIVGSTDTVWIWDTDNSEWVDSDQKGQVTSVNGQTGDVVLDLLPTQTGQSGKFLTTDGTDASWSDKPLVNTATGLLSLSVGSSTTNDFVTVFGDAQVSQGFATALGYGTVVSGQNGTAVGYGAEVSANNATAIGSQMQATAANAIQLGCVGFGIQAANSDANTFKVANNNGNFEIMSADGTVPTARLTKVNTTATLAAAGWSNSSQTVNITGMTADGVVLVSPTPANQSAYTSAGILCTAQAAGSLTFTCDTVPSADITVTVVML